jgi:hypothetical protein
MSKKPNMRQNLGRRQLQKFEVFRRLLLHIAHDDFSQWFPFFGVQYSIRMRQEIYICIIYIYIVYTVDITYLLI